jgi:hypothetical protein
MPEAGRLFGCQSQTRHFEELALYSLHQGLVVHMLAPNRGLREQWPRGVRRGSKSEARQGSTGTGTSAGVFVEEFASTAVLRTPDDSTLP